MDSNAAATILPTHAADDKLQRRRHRRRRCCCVCLLVSLGAAALLAVTLLVLFLTALRVRDPTTRLVSSRVIGFTPGPDLQFNLTMLLTVDVHNPNRASFSYESGSAELWYRGVRVGVAGIDPGHLPSRGDGTMELEMTVLSASFGAELLAQLARDLGAGAVPLDANARVPGKVGLLGGVLKLRAVAYSDCHVIFGVPEMKVRSQVCHDHTKL
ncbi:uncharacterized protein LOC120690876 [Panicum virgatum]|jgi:hypothetical protein|uniref:Late embryogenesis abundant protein LEA-2 subgroup domain-containing protein n=1 Tax=Panicum virgatum TaxID=38727 RepID=A0A8T0MQA3_PANVG|nr:uncharacterized protein LOC120687794 [Panicum virgatum]XP_039829675.1 uncharacterized protein LOC120690876 [Panicum virgatum]KAG2536946.1 hypothetical protein PVAP13_9NG238073 [Panicum virgatum]KAG2536950.1 hypothetical protein PVAP13_9NG238100 [Panicum virgatum]